jgi:hypothetical protein
VWRFFTTINERKNLTIGISTCNSNCQYESWMKRFEVQTSRRDESCHPTTTCCTTCLQCWCVTDELGELWVSNFIKEVYSQFVESRGIDADHEIFQIFAETSESEGGENGEDRSLWWKRKARA